MVDSSFIAARREDSENAHLWGLYSVENDRWLPITFQFERDAVESAAIVNLKKRRPRDREVGR